MLARTMQAEGSEMPMTYWNSVDPSVTASEAPAEDRAGLIYRVEHTEDGRGPWAGGGGNAVPPLDAGRLPLPGADGLTDVPWHDGTWLHGFDAINKLYYWFTTRDREILRERGFCIAVYRGLDARCCLKGGQQLVFRQDRAELLQRMPI